MIVTVTEPVFPTLAIRVDVTFVIDKSNVSVPSKKSSFKIVIVTSTVKLLVAPTLKVATRGAA